MTQEVFLHVLRRLDQLREPERFAGWLRQVTVRMAINRATRRIAPASVESGVLEATCEHRNDPLDELISRERASGSGTRSGGSRRSTARPWWPSTSRAESLVEIAEALDVPIGTIKRRLHTARKRLKAELEASTGDADEWSDFPASGDDEDAFDADLVGAATGTDDALGW